MKNTLKCIALVLITLQLTNASAQLQLPQPSPKASVMQQIGLTDITIEYSSPAVRGRVIWGELLPFDQVWRAGANAATKITFSKDVTIEGTTVAKGTYSIFAFPGKTEWQIALNKDVTASEDSYKKENDVVRIKTTAVNTGVNRERLQYSFSDFDAENATINLEWEKMRVSFKVICATGKQAAENIDKTLSSTWNQYNNAARYYYDLKDYAKAMEYVNQSIALSNQWFNNWVKAQILAAQGNAAEAYKHAVVAKELGDKNPDGFFFKTQVEKALVDWKPADTGKKKKK